MNLPVFLKNRSRNSRYTGNEYAHRGEFLKVEDNEPELFSEGAERRICTELRSLAFSPVFMFSE